MRISWIERVENKLILRLYKKKIILAREYVMQLIIILFLIIIL